MEKSIYVRNYKAKKTNERKGVLYLIIDYPAIKIGFTKSLAQRMTQYRTCNPYVKLIDVIDGSMDDEKYYHSQMKKMLKPLDPTSELYEWYIIPKDKKQYKEILEQGIKYFA